MAEPVLRWAPHHGEWTEADLDTMPDDGNRYEILDGKLIVVPHQVKRTRAPVWRWPCC